MCWPYWFSLSGDIVTNLQLQIDELREGVKISNEVLNEYGLPVTSNFNDLFDNIYKRFKMIMLEKALITLTVRLNTGSPAKGLKVTGITNEDGTVAVTNQNGMVTGFINKGSTTVSISGYTDLEPFSKTYSISQGETYSYTVIVNINNYKRFDASATIMFSQNVKTISYSVCGGGGSGGKAYNTSNNTAKVGGGGGGGGYCTTKTNVTVTPDTNYQVSVGASNSQSSFMDTIGNPGGYATGTLNGNGHYSVGGIGNGNGGDGAWWNYSTSSEVFAQSGSPGTDMFYYSFTEQGVCGGGGGGGGCGGNATIKIGASGGSYGGKGGDTRAAYEAGTNGGNGSAPGGGGGGAGAGDVSGSNGGSGGNGAVAIRMYF